MAIDTLALEPSDTFVETPATREILERALIYLACGYSVNFSGPAGTGKTTLALHTAHVLGRPTSVLTGDEEMTSLSMVGGYLGIRHRRIDDNFIRSVHKVSDEYRELWVDNRLTVACQDGYTLVYDEFTRSRPETNTVLLSVLEEHILHFPVERGGRERYLPVHPDFRLILTSNPAEYAGVFQTADALRDRMITISLNRPDRATEVAIVEAKAALSHAHAERIVGLVRTLSDDRRLGVRLSLRNGIMLGRIAHHLQVEPDPRDPRWREIVLDVVATSADERDLLAAAIASAEDEGPGAGGSDGGGSQDGNDATDAGRRAGSGNGTAHGNGRGRSRSGRGGSEPR